MTPDTLTPRPDSETLIHAALSLIADRTVPLRILDLGTGTGCLLLALLHELPAARGLGIDKSAAPLAVAERNAAALGLAERARFALGDWTAGLTESFDLILCNPPYIPTGEIAGLMPEVARGSPIWPSMAARMGSPAIACWRPSSRRGWRRAATPWWRPASARRRQSQRLLAAAGLMPIGRRCDLGGRERCVIAKKTKQ